MLVELAVENYAVIEKVRVRFHPGLNLLTGETGSGKSIIVDALALLLGGRASAEMVRAGADRARISGIFEVAESATLLELLEPAGIELEDRELLIEREVLPNGKSRVFVGSRPATAALLRSLAPHLADIHGQHDQQHLFSPGVQRQMLDAFAGCGPLLDEIAAVYTGWRDAAAAIAELDRAEQENLRLVDLWTFQRREIETVEPLPCEDEKLENERRVLRNIVRLEETASGAYAALYDAPESVSVQLRAALRRLEEVARIDESIAEVQQTLQPAVIAVDEAAHALSRYLGKLDADPGRLDEVESRLASLEKLKRKYGATVQDVLAFLEETHRQLAAVESSADRRQSLRREVDQLAQTYRSLDAQLHARRVEAARQLSKRVQTELAALAMERTRVEFRMSETPWSAQGTDAVEILLSPNPGEEPKPLDKIASGGELSRVALALKTCTAPARSVHAAIPITLVFDEVDAGVGGGAAEAVGRRLKKLGSSSQVLCVTHLPQIAGFADHHYYVEKRTVKGRTVASIEELGAAERTHEIGRMLSGERVTPEALRHAEQLLKMAAD